MITKEQVKEILTKKSGRNYKRRVEICFLAYSAYQSKNMKNQNIIFGLKYISNAYTSLKFDMV